MCPKRRVSIEIAAFLLLGLLAPSTRAQKQPPNSDQNGIDKIVRLTAAEHATILFSVADQSIGYARDGQLEWVDAGHDQQRVECGWPHPALSHNGLQVAFVSDGKRPKSCEILIRDMRTGIQRELIETDDDPGEISWSWDDTEIVFLDHVMSAVSVKDGSTTILLPSSRRKIGDREFEFWVWYPMQWFHNDKDLVVEANLEISTRESGTYDQQSNLLLVTGERARLIGPGSQPAVSPIADQIAYYASDGVVLADLDMERRTVLTNAPRYLLFFEEELFWKIVWSPDGSRLFFGTIVSEDRRDNLYLLGVKSHRREKFLSRTSITIRGWQ